MPEQTETRLPGAKDTIILKGRDARVQDITGFFDSETPNIVEFLNHSVKAGYTTIYEEIMSKYEAKLKRGNIFDHNFPEAKFACKEIDVARLENNSTHLHNDKEIIDILLKEYHACLDDLKDHFKQYEGHVERWYNTLPAEAKKIQ
jgi:hypothetical protein